MSHASPRQPSLHWHTLLQHMPLPAQSSGVVSTSVSLLLLLLLLLPPSSASGAPSLSNRNNAGRGASGQLSVPTHWPSSKHLSSLVHALPSEHGVSTGAKSGTHSPSTQSNVAQSLLRAAQSNVCYCSARQLDVCAFDKTTYFALADNPPATQT